MTHDLSLDVSLHPAQYHPYGAYGSDNWSQTLQLDTPSMKPARPKRLSLSFVRTVNRPGRYGDGHGGHGLSLLVKPRAHGGFAKSWSQRLRINGKPCNIGLGPFPIVTLAEAREAALENARAVFQGRDPRERSTTPTFDKAAEIVIKMRAGTWRNPLTADVWRSSFRRLVSPAIGGKPVSAVTSADVLSVLMPIWNDGKHETARRLRHRIGAVMRWPARWSRFGRPRRGQLQSCCWSTRS